MRHQTQDVAFVVENTGDVVQRPIRVGAVTAASVGVDVAKGDAVFVPQALKRVFVSEEVAIVVADRDSDNGVLAIGAGEDGVGGLDLQIHVPTDELEPCVPHKDTQQEPAFGQYLEAVANAQNRHALIGARFDLAHHWRQRCQRTGAQVIAVGKTARDDN